MVLPFELYARWVGPSGPAFKISETRPGITSPRFVSIVNFGQKNTSSTLHHDMSKKLSLATRLTPVLPPGVVLPSKSRRPQLGGPSSGREPALPFFRDPAHTVPTLRLYRHLLRHTSGRYLLVTEDDVPSSSELRWALTSSWRAKRPLTSIPRVKAFLERNLALLSSLTSGSSEDLKSAVEDPTKTDQYYRRQMAIREARAAAAQPPALRQPQLTGGFLRPTLFNPPLPRLKPQPEHISMMILHRLRARENRQAKFRILQEWGKYMKHEMAFYRDVHSPTLSNRSDGETKRRGRQIRQVEVTGVDADFIGGWDEESNRANEVLQERFSRENARAESKFSEELVERVKEAKKRVLAEKRERAERRKNRSQI